MDQSSLPRYRYTIDGHDVITSVCPLWLAFARENGAPQLSQEAVVGRSLWQFIAGHETREMYQSILQHVRRDNTSCVIPFRCDSPTLRRYMRLELTPAAAGTVQFDGLLERVEHTTPYNLLETSFPRSQQILTFCSSCKKILLENFGWLEVDDVEKRLHLQGKQHVPRMRHSLCPECLTTASTITNTNRFARAADPRRTPNLAN